MKIMKVIYGHCLFCTVLFFTAFCTASEDPEKLNAALNHAESFHNHQPQPTEQTSQNSPQPELNPTTQVPVPEIQVTPPKEPRNRPKGLLYYLTCCGLCCGICCDGCCGHCDLPK